jgi:hypothetical protein
LRVCSVQRPVVVSVWQSGCAQRVGGVVGMAGPRDIGVRYGRNPRPAEGGVGSPGVSSPLSVPA